VANTIKGFGIDFMENQVKWHYKSPNSDEHRSGHLELNKRFT
jgi:transketolase